MKGIESMQVFPPTTPLKVDGITRVTTPRESRDVRYIRYIDPQTGVIRFVPTDTALNLDCDHGVEVVAKKDGERRTYAAMPACTEGVRYRRVRDRATGIVTMTPIHWPAPTRITREESGDQKTARKP